MNQVIKPSVPRATFSSIKGWKNLMGVWVVLKQIYEKPRAMAADLMRRIRNMRCGKNDNVLTHFENLGSLREQPVSMGKLIATRTTPTSLLLLSHRSMTPRAPPTVTVRASAANFSLPTYSGVTVSHPR